MHNVSATTCKEEEGLDTAMGQGHSAVRLIQYGGQDNGKQHVINFIRVTTARMQISVCIDIATPMKEGHKSLDIASKQGHRQRGQHISQRPEQWLTQ